MPNPFMLRHGTLVTLHTFTSLPFNATVDVLDVLDVAALWMGQRIVSAAKMVDTIRRARINDGV